MQGGGFFFLVVVHKTYFILILIFVSFLNESQLLDLAQSCMFSLEDPSQQSGGIPPKGATGLIPLPFNNTPLRFLQ